MHMARKLALLDYYKCRPDACEGGVYASAQVCPSKLLKQEAAYTVPMPEPSSCRACGDCVRACPQKAIRLVSS
ncbi:MAG TPA: 4Fe-4S binding protein [Dehalococcoidales bacterium]|nr:4Fe-4S binding protein [Dehalococcoidales bacterium]